MEKGDNNYKREQVNIIIQLAIGVMKELKQDSESWMKGPSLSLELEDMFQVEEAQSP